MGVGSALAAGCGGDGGGSLLGALGGPARDDGGDPANGDDSGIAAAIEAGQGMALAQKMFNAINWASCVQNCHTDGNESAPKWLAPPDAYASIKTYDAAQTGNLKFIMQDPTQSRLYTKGLHEGPGLTLTSDLGKSVKQWLDVEAAVLRVAKLPTTPPFTVTNGQNVTVDVSALGTGVAGAQIMFTVAITGGIISLANMKLVAPATTGVHLVHPTFIMVVANPDGGAPNELADSADSFSNGDVSVAAGQTKQLGDGLAVLDSFGPARSSWVAGAQLEISAVKLESAKVSADAGEEAGGGGGCKNVPGFQSIAADFTGNESLNCVNCHGGSNANATSAMDLTALGGGTPNYAAACAQALNKVNLANKPQSAIIQAPTGGINHAGGQIADKTGFTNDVLNKWLNGE
jgi:hypothetical protein